MTSNTIEYIADANVFCNGNKLQLREANGQPIVSLCMFLLGFTYKEHNSVISRLVEDTEEKTTDVLTRYHTLPTVGRFSKVYTGRRRMNHQPLKEIEHMFKNIFFNGDIMHYIDGTEELVELKNFY